VTIQAHVGNQDIGRVELGNMKILITESQYKILTEGRFVDFQLDNDEITLEVWDSGERLDLESIIIPKHLRKMGYGTKTMKMVTDYADNMNKPIFLTPDTSFGGTSIKRLIEFYKKFGFEKNNDKSLSKHYLVRYPVNNI
jgi:GNAT superfamily N-acetyltransferase